jgi:hypothetical protein
MQNLQPEITDAKLTPSQLCLSCQFYRLLLFSRNPDKYWKICDAKLDPNVIMAIGRNCSLRQEIPLSEISNTSSPDAE